MLPGTVNVVRGAVERAGQVPDLGNLPTLRGDTLEDILAEQEEVPVTPQRSGLICNINSYCKTCGVTHREDSIPQSVPGALCRTKPS